ncbi:MAG TPA: TolC family protein [Longimicrobium sp.]|jgi:outer membrane protein TolC
MTPHRTAATLVALAALLSAPSSLRAQDAAPLTLERAVASALEGSPEIQRARAAGLLERASVTESFAPMLPRLSLSTGLNRSDVLQRTATDPVTGGIVQLPDSLVERRYTFGTAAVVSVDWTVFAGGRNLAAASVARARARAAGHELGAARVKAAAEATLAYLDALEADALVQVRRAQEAHARELERTAQARFETGDVPEIDLLQARLAASEANLAVIEAEGDARARRLALYERTGMEGDLGAPLQAPEPLAAVDTAGLRARMSAASPVLAGAAAERQAAARAVRAGRLGLLPTVTVGMDRVWSEWGQTREAFTMEPRNAQAYYRLSLAWSPLERSGQLWAERQRAAAALLAADADGRAARRTIEREVEVGLERWVRAGGVGERAALNLALAERQREQAEERYRVGLGTLTDRLNANALWAEAARQAALARHARLRAAAELERATGAAVMRPMP